MIEFIDRTVEPIVSSSFRDADILARNVKFLPSFELPDLAVNASIEQGSLELIGALGARPLEGQFTITGNRLPFSSFRGYLQQLFRRTEWSGDTLNGELKLALITGSDNRVGTELAGNLSGERMSLRFPDEENAFLSSRQVSVNLRSLRTGEPRGLNDWKAPGWQLRRFTFQNAYLVPRSASSNAPINRPSEVVTKIVSSFFSRM